MWRYDLNPNASTRLPYYGTTRKVLKRKVLTRKVLNLKICLRVVLAARRRCYAIENIALDNVVRLG